MLFQTTTLGRTLDTAFSSAGYRQLWYHPRDFSVAVAYTTGLIAHQAKRAVFQVLCQTTGVHVQELSEFLNPQILGWPQQVLFDTLIRSLPPGGELITDLFVVPKDNTTTMEATKMWSSCLRRLVDGQAYALLVWTQGTRSVVIGCRMLQAEDDVASVTLGLIEHALALGLQVRALLADGDYCKLPFSKALRRLKLTLVSKIRRDTKWFFGCEQWKLTQWAQSLDISSCHYYPGFGYAKGAVMARHGWPPCKVVVLRPTRRCPAKHWIYLLCTDPTRTMADILRARKRRWRIEVVIRDSSQHLGLKQHQGHQKTSQAHVLMCFLAYNFLSEFKALHGGTLGAWRRGWAKLYERERTSLSAPLMPSNLDLLGFPVAS